MTVSRDMSQTNVIRRCAKLAREGKAGDATQLLQRALRNHDIDPGDYERAGRLLTELFEDDPDRFVDLHVHLAGQCTTSFMLPVLTAEAWARGSGLCVTEAGYDNVIQDLAARTNTPDVIIILPWHQRLLRRDGRSTEDRMADEISVLRAAWKRVGEIGSRLIQVGYDWLHAGPEGFHVGGRDEADVGITRCLNHQIRELMPRGGWFIDLEAVSASAGHRHFYDARNYHWTKNPLTVDGTFLLCRHLWAGIRGLTTGPKKVLALDLDDTLWGGVVGEVGPGGVELGESPAGEAHRAFQAYCKDLAGRGVLLAIVSKNNPEDAEAPFRDNDAMILSLDDFAAVHAGWQPKSAALQTVADRLQLGLDSFVFFDDNPAERLEVRQNAPEVEVIEPGDDPAEFIGALEESLFFETVSITREDRRRTHEYRTRSRRDDASLSAVSLESYLESLQMTADVCPINDADMPRVVQLIGKTNQFNLTARRHSEAQLRQMLGRDRAIGLTLRLADRFGDYGLIAVVIGNPVVGDPESLCIDTLLMSCRVNGRTVEHALINRLAEDAGRLGYLRIIGEYRPTAKNRLVEGLYPAMGFTSVAEECGRYETLLDEFHPCPTFVSAAGGRRSKMFAA